MKKEYIKPKIITCHIQSCGFICVSNVYGQVESVNGRSTLQWGGDADEMDKEIDPD